MEFIKKTLNNNLYAISLYCRQITGTLVLFLIAHYLPVYDYGLFSSYKNIAFFCLMMANLSFDEYILVSSKANVHKVKLKISLFILNAFLITLATILFSFCFKLDSHLLFMLVAIRVFFDNIFFALILPYFQSANKFNVIARINIIYAIFILLIGLLSNFMKLSLFSFLLLNIILGFINFIQCSYYVKINYIIALTRFKKLIQMLDKGVFVFISVTFMGLLYVQIAPLYVSTFITKEDAALFFAAYTISTIVNLIINAQVQKMIPEMIKTDISAIKSIIKNNLFFIVGIVGSVLLFMAVFGKILLKLLYGQAYYISAYPILLILICANLCVAVTNTFGAYITASGNQAKKLPMQIEATVITILCLLLLHKYGIYGATISFLISTIYTTLRYVFVTLNLIKSK